jgi:hypothetical protein
VELSYAPVADFETETPENAMRIARKITDARQTNHPMIPTRPSCKNVRHE